MGARSYTTAPKGPNKPARGNAPGQCSYPGTKPCKGATTMVMAIVVAPLQGDRFRWIRYPGRCPGLIGWAPSGREDQPENLHAPCGFRVPNPQSYIAVPVNRPARQPEKFDRAPRSPRKVTAWASRNHRKVAQCDNPKSFAPATCRRDRAQPAKLQRGLRATNANLPNVTTRKVSRRLDPQSDKCAEKLRGKTSLSAGTTCPRSRCAHVFLFPEQGSASPFRLRLRIGPSCRPPRGLGADAKEKRTGAAPFCRAEQRLALALLFYSCERLDSEWKAVGWAEGREAHRSGQQAPNPGRDRRVIRFGTEASG